MAWHSAIARRQSGEPPQSLAGLLQGQSPAPAESLIPAVSTNKQVFTSVKTHQHHRLETVFSFIFEKNYRIYGSCSGKFVRHDGRDVEIFGKVETLHLANFCIAVT